jgi:A/G-specific adenine glycosylase
MATHSEVTNLTAEERREQVWGALLAWYATEGRTHLPWRETRDPYAVLVSEVMLQQTQVERVLPKYREFLARFPTFQALAAEPVGEAIKAWAGLGYNQRAVRLHGIARQVVEEFGGQLPATLDGLTALKGIGRYTAGAVACFAFGLPVATVDTNIRRALWRVFRGVEPVPWPGGETAARMFLELAEWALPRNHAYDWQQALMDLGARICLARKPLCERCPLSAQCAAYAETAQVALFPSGEALARLRDERAASEDPPQSRRVAESGVSYGAASSPKRRRRATTTPFEQTSRYFRGRIVNALRDLAPGATLSLAALGPRVKPEYTEVDLPWLRELARGLARDGLARLSGTGDDETIALP